ncbi:hypothetical protein G6F31_021105 [Rhizopus arrhizus]|nr:hypothetical protein G6F31_021105 [Rhizopus arrhizus]
MPRTTRLEQLDLLPYIGKWLVISFIVACLAGSASAFFLHALDWATNTRDANPRLIWLLPIAGFVVGWCYLRMGRPVTAVFRLDIKHGYSSVKDGHRPQVAPA